MNTHFRWTQLLPLIAVAALAGITWWLLQATLPPPGEGAAQPKRHT
ncbi:LPS export ABC transporter periplasmic protein LptC, partial [Paraburkholderia sp. SIMBA_049]